MNIQQGRYYVCAVIYFYNMYTVSTDVENLIDEPFLKLKPKMKNVCYRLNKNCSNKLFDGSL